MAEVAVNDILKATWMANHTSPNTKVIQDFYWRVDTLNDGGEANNGNDLQTRCVDIFTTIQARLSTRYVLERIRVTNQTQKELLLDGPPAGGFAGTNASLEVLPAQDAVLVVVRSRKLGHQGRKYLGPIPEDVVADGKVDPVSLADFTSFGATWDSSFNGGVTTNLFTPGTVKFAPGGAVQSFTPFDDFLETAFEDMRTQRSRRPGVGLG